MKKTYNSRVGQNNKEMKERRRKRRMKKARSRKGHRYFCRLVFCDLRDTLVAMLFCVAPIILSVICGFIMQAFPNFF